MRIVLAAGLAVAMLATAAVRAEVVEQTETTFKTRNVVEIAASAEKAYAALGEVGRWWNGEHSYSGQAANMTLPLRPGACFCEALPGGGVAHGTVALAWPAQGMLRLDAALGPLQEEGVSGALTFLIKPKGQGVEVTQTYAVGGGRPGMAKQYAPIVDQVVREQLVRFGRYVATGRPE